MLHLTGVGGGAGGSSIRNVHFQKTSISTPRKSIGNSEGRGSQKAKFSMESVKFHWNFMRGVVKGIFLQIM